MSASNCTLVGKLLCTIVSLLWACHALIICSPDRGFPCHPDTLSCRNSCQGVLCVILMMGSNVTVTHLSRLNAQYAEVAKQPTCNQGADHFSKRLLSEVSYVHYNHQAVDAKCDILKS